MTQTTERADASPTKAFFVRMITRDISLEDCIMDLIDNSIDGAWRREGHRPMGLEQDVDLSPYGIEIAMSPERFSIIDDCGGMSLDCQSALNSFQGTASNIFQLVSTVSVAGCGV
jgi:hypothetical protein